MDNSQRVRYLLKINKMKKGKLLVEIGRLTKWVTVNIEQRSVHYKIFRKDIQMRIDEINILLEQIKKRTEPIFKKAIHPNRLLELKDKLEKAKKELAANKAAKKIWNKSNVKKKQEKKRKEDKEKEKKKEKENKELELLAKNWKSHGKRSRLKTNELKF